MTIFDPPSGWQYGFPKEIPDGILGDEILLKLWLLQQGYPEKLLELACKYSRYWEETDV